MWLPFLFAIYAFIAKTTLSQRFKTPFHGSWARRSEISACMGIRWQIFLFAKSIFTQVVNCNLKYEAEDCILTKFKGCSLARRHAVNFNNFPHLCLYIFFRELAQNVQNIIRIR